MRLSLITILLFMLSSAIWAETNYEGLTLADAPINRSDMESIKRGAKFFSNTCMSCHTLVYLKYDKIAQDAGITLEKMPLNVKDWPNGVKPPDLSLEASIRGTDWIYTYLHSFYQDPKRPTGANNLLVPNTAMPAILAPFQGDQVLATDQIEPSILFHQTEWYDYVQLVKQGSMKPEEFDATVADVVNFLAYAAEPYHEEQEKLGYWVLGFLILLFPLMYLLKVEYWKDIKKRKE